MERIIYLIGQSSYIYINRLELNNFVQKIRSKRDCRSISSRLSTLNINIIRFVPPLVITEEQLRECIGIIKKTIASFE